MIVQRGRLSLNPHKGCSFLELLVTTTGTVEWTMPRTITTISAHGPDILPKKVNALDSGLSGFYSSYRNDSLTIVSGQFGKKGNGSKVGNTRTCVQI